MRNTVCCLAALLATLCSTAAHATSWELKPGSDNRLEFTATFEQTPVTGVFKDFRVRFDFDPQKPDSNRLNVSIRISSADMANPDINQAIAGKDWFDFVRYPEAVFDAKEILNAPGAAGYRARGTLQLKGHRQPLVLPFSWKPEERRMEGEFVTHRSIFDIGTGEWKSSNAVGDAVTVKFRIQLRELP